MPEHPRQELVVALAGPAVNVVIALGLYLVLGRFLSAEDLVDVGGGRGNVLAKLLAVNVILVVFNLLPAFPMDGGRVLRALLATRLKRGRATRIAAAVGQGMAVIFGLLGLFGNPMLLFIAVFVFFGAQQEAAYATAKEYAEETRVAGVMDPVPPLLREQMTVLDAVRAAMRESRPVYPVVDEGMRLRGLVPAAALAGALDAGQLSAPLSSLTVPAAPAVTAGSSLAEAGAALSAAPWPCLPVVNQSGQIVGMLTREGFEAAFGG
jgi:stage IV sporulation protein FB